MPDLQVAKLGQWIAWRLGSHHQRLRRLHHGWEPLREHAGGDGPVLLEECDQGSVKVFNPAIGPIEIACHS